MKRISNSLCTVVLCTYNGAAFLQEQLESILSQTRRPDAMVVGDDGSSDSTLNILTEFKNRAPFPVTIHHGESRPLGPAANFGRTLELASGDWFALCDQDDIWHKNKLERLEGTLRADLETVLVFSDASLVGADKSPLGTTLWQRVGLGRTELTRFEKDEAILLLLKRYRVMGAAMAFVAELKNLVLPVPPGWPHDAWIATVAASTGRVVALNEALLDYRQHGNNAVGGLSPSWWKLLKSGVSSDREVYLANEIVRYRLLLQHLANLGKHKGERLSFSRELAQEKLAHLERRAALPSRPFARWPRIFRAWKAGEYRRWTTDWRGLALDLFMPNTLNLNPDQTTGSNRSDSMLGKTSALPRKAVSKDIGSDGSENS